MGYIENPKTKGSGILCCIPQHGRCAHACADCFFQSGRSYLEPLGENTPNMPTLEQVGHRVVRVNDGNDSLLDAETVLSATKQYPLRFYNTCANAPELFPGLPAPVVWTVNPGDMTDRAWYSLGLLESAPPQLMFVRVRTNTWNIDGVVDPAIDYYTSRGVPVVLTFMAYHSRGSIPPTHRCRYLHRKRTSNDYWAISTGAFHDIMWHYRHNVLVYSCGHIEGERGSTACRYCGNCLREYFAARERMANND